MIDNGCHRLRDGCSLQTHVKTLANDRVFPAPVAEKVLPCRGERCYTIGESSLLTIMISIGLLGFHPILFRLFKQKQYGFWPVDMTLVYLSESECIWVEINR